jgi:hypothetical protein
LEIKIVEQITLQKNLFALPDFTKCIPEKGYKQIKVKRN